jgi:hypothetical protein
MYEQVYAQWQNTPAEQLDLLEAQNRTDLAHRADFLQEYQKISKILQSSLLNKAGYSRQMRLQRTFLAPRTKDVVSLDRLRSLWEHETTNEHHARALLCHFPKVATLSMDFPPAGLRILANPEAAER